MDFAEILKPPVIVRQIAPGKVSLLIILLKNFARKDTQSIVTQHYPVSKPVRFPYVNCAIDDVKYWVK